jgi:FlaA1/EpsC-like NDP-sugar epimerase
MGKGGEIFILDMGTSIKIDDMARDLIRLSGFEPDVDIKIEYVGLRPGEKLYEELITEGENIVPTSHEKIMVLKGIECDLELLNGKIDKLARLA